MHVSALSTELGALGIDFPDKPAGPAQYDPLARALATASRSATPSAAIALEHGLVADLPGGAAGARGPEGGHHAGHAAGLAMLSTSSCCAPTMG